MRAGYEGRGPGPDNAKTILMLSSILDNYPEALCKHLYLKFPKIHSKTPVSESLF